MFKGKDNAKIQWLSSSIQETEWTVNTLINKIIWTQKTLNHIVENAGLKWFLLQDWWAEIIDYLKFPKKLRPAAQQFIIQKDILERDMQQLKLIKESLDRKREDLYIILRQYQELQTPEFVHWSYIMKQIEKVDHTFVALADAVVTAEWKRKSDNQRERMDFLTADFKENDEWNRKISTVWFLISLFSHQKGSQTEDAIDTVNRLQAKLAEEIQSLEWLLQNIQDWSMKEFLENLGLWDTIKWSKLAGMFDTGMMFFNLVPDWLTSGIKVRANYKVKRNLASKMDQFESTHNTFRELTDEWKNVWSQVMIALVEKTR